MNNKTILVLLLVIYFIALSFRLVNSPRNFEWSADSARDYLVSKYIHIYHEDIHVGHFANGFNDSFYHFPDYYRLLSTFHYFSSTQEGFIRTLLILGASVVFPMFLLVFSVTGRQKIAILSSLLTAINPYYLHMSLQLRGTAFTCTFVIWSIGFYFFGIKYRKYQYVLLGLFLSIFVCITSYVFVILPMTLLLHLILIKNIPKLKLVSLIIATSIFVSFNAFPFIRALGLDSLSSLNRVEWEKSGIPFSHQTVDLFTQISSMHLKYYGFGDNYLLIILVGFLLIPNRKTIIGYLKNKNNHIFASIIISIGSIPFCYLLFFTRTDIPDHWLAPSFISINLLLLLYLMGLIGQSANSVGVKTGAVVSILIVTGIWQCISYQGNTSPSVNLYEYSSLAKETASKYGTHAASSLLVVSTINDDKNNTFGFKSVKFWSEFGSITKHYKLTNDSMNIDPLFLDSDYALLLCEYDVAESSCLSWFAEKPTHYLDHIEDKAEGKLYVFQKYKVYTPENLPLK